MDVILSEEIVAAIDEHLVQHPPERLLHILGRHRPDGSIEATRWVLDAAADASQVHVRASDQAEHLIQSAAIDHDVRYLGVVHSHPAGVPEPSGQDIMALGDLLRVNPEVGSVLVGVVVPRRTKRRGRTAHGEVAVHSQARGARPAPVDLSAFDPDRDFLHGIAERLTVGYVSTVNDAHVVVVGLGSLGSQCAEAVARAGVPSVTLIDPDRVEVANLGRTIYSNDQVGVPKGDAFVDQPAEINPGIRVRILGLALESTIAAQLPSADLVLGTADDQRALAILEALLHDNGVLGVFAGVHRAVVGGDSVSVFPGLTVSHPCSVAPRVQATDLQPGTGYASGRLQCETALAADIVIGRPTGGCSGVTSSRRKALTPRAATTRSTSSVPMVAGAARAAASDPTCGPVGEYGRGISRRLRLICHVHPGTRRASGTSLRVELGPSHGEHTYGVNCAATKVGLSVGRRHAPMRSRLDGSWVWRTGGPVSLEGGEFQ